MRNNLQSEKTSNASAGKHFVFGKGPIKDKLLKGGTQFDAKKILMATNHNFEQEKIATEAPLKEPQKCAGNLCPPLTSHFILPSILISLAHCELLYFDLTNA